MHFLKNFTNILNPHNILKYSKNLQKFFIFFTLYFIICGLFFGLYFNETDFQQGENYRIIYIHVPFAWLSLLIYISLAVCSLIYLITQHPFFELINKHIAWLGFTITFLTLITGSFWGFPVWGTFWVWDARLTSVFILFLIYLSYIILSSVSTNIKSKNAASIIAIFGLINIPIIKFSVNWWNTLHQGISISIQKTTIELSMIFPIFFLFFGFIFLLFNIFIYMIRIELINQKLLTSELIKKNLE